MIIFKYGANDGAFLIPEISFSSSRDNKYVVKIDKETTAELNSFMAKLPGHVNVAMDGVTVLGKQKVSLPCPV